MRKREKRKLPSNTAQAPQRIWLIPIVIVVLDQLTKLIATALLETVKNTGTIFGLLANKPAIVLTAAGIILVGMMVHLIRRQPDSRRQRIYVFAMMLILGGGVANMLDRVLHGYVIDFIKLPLWPTFNFADLCITCGVTIIVWQGIFHQSIEAYTEAE